MDEQLDESQDLSVWQLIFLQSKVNGAQYRGDELFPQKWDWPRDTYLQRRLRNPRGVHIRSRAEIEQNLFREIFEVEQLKKGLIIGSSLFQSEV